MSELRGLGPDDWALWREIRLRSLTDSPDAFGSTLERERQYSPAEWREDLDEGWTVAICGPNAPIACGAVFEKSPGRAAIVAMWIDPGHRGRGHSRRMLDALVGWARDRDLSVEIGVNRANPVARAAYEAYGFVTTGHSHPLRDGSSQVCDVLTLG